MGPLLNPTLANIFMYHHKTIWFKRWSKNFWPKCYKRFVDDIIALFEKCEHLEQFAEYMNKRHPNIRSSAKAEKNDALPFLDIKTHTENGKFPVCTGKKLSVVCTQFLPVSFYLNISLICCTSFFINVFA